MRGNPHVRFGGRAEETDRPEGRQRASVRPNHTAVALAVAQGAHPKAIQRRMGHSTINMTLDRYGHLFPELDQKVASDIGATLQEASRARGAGTIRSLL